MIHQDEEQEKMNFYSQLNKTIAQNQSLLVVGLDPNLEILPILGNRSIANCSDPECATRF